MSLARRLATRRGGHPRRAAWGVGLFVVVTPVLYVTAVSWGHGEELFVALALVEAALLAAGSRPVRAGLVIGAAVAVKVLAVVGAPVVIAAGWRATWRAAAVTAAVVAVAYGPFLVLGDVQTFTFTWGADQGASTGAIGAVTGLSGWAMRIVQGGLAAAACTLIAWRRPVVPELAVAGALLARAATDPLPLPYYPAAATLLLALWAWTSPAATAPARTAVVLGSGALCAAMLAPLPDRPVWLWAPVGLGLLVVACRVERAAAHVPDVTCAPATTT
jgi:hypothetical protein